MLQRLLLPDLNGDSEAPVVSLPYFGSQHLLESTTWDKSWAGHEPKPGLNCFRVVPEGRIRRLDPPTVYYCLDGTVVPWSGGKVSPPYQMPFYVYHPSEYHADGYRNELAKIWDRIGSTYKLYAEGDITQEEYYAHVELHHEALAYLRRTCVHSRCESMKCVPENLFLVGHELGTVCDSHLIRLLWRAKVPDTLPGQSSGRMKWQQSQWFRDAAEGVEKIAWMLKRSAKREKRWSNARSEEDTFYLTPECFAGDIDAFIARLRIQGDKEFDSLVIR